MKRILLPLTALACLFSVSALAQGKMVVAVEKFDNQADAPAEFFTTLRTRITGDIVNTRKFEIVEREQLKQVLAEQNLAAAGITDEEDAPQQGKIKSAGYVIYGTVLSLGLDQTAVQTGSVAGKKTTIKVEVQLRFSNAETGKIVATKTVSSAKSQGRAESTGVQTKGNAEEQALNDAIREVSKQVTDALMELAYPAKIIAVGKQDITLNLTQEQVAIDDLYDVFEMGDELTDPDTGEALGAEEELVGRVKISRPGPKTSKAEPVGKLDLGDLKPGMLVRRVSEAALGKEKADQKKATQKAFEGRF